MNTSFVSLSRRIGVDSMLVQAAGGNTSIKEGTTIWIKASGKWLAHADREETFIPLDLSLARQLIDQEKESELTTSMLYSSRALRPSIETSLHVLLPHKVVLHLHSIRTLNWACRVDITELEHRLHGVSWSFIPYHRPGFPLTKIVRDLHKGEEFTDVLVLGNHGLIIGAPSCDAAEELLHAVEHRLDSPKREPPPPNIIRLNALLVGTPYRLPMHEESHGLATDSSNYLIAIKGSLYPDHVVFLGGGIVGIDSTDAFSELLVNSNRPTVVLIKYIGTLVRQDLSESSEEMLRALALLAMRIDPRAQLRYLDETEESALLNWEAERYRQSQAITKSVS